MIFRRLVVEWGTRAGGFIYLGRGVKICELWILEHWDFLCEFFLHMANNDHEVYIAMVLENTPINLTSLKQLLEVLI